MTKTKIYLEIGKKKVFACAVDWPAWCRSGRNEDSAMLSLFESGPRLAKVLENTDFGFQEPRGLAQFEVVERLEGNATTDFGGPGVIPEADKIPLKDTDLANMITLIEACWGPFDLAAQAAVGKKLRKGPRGGGRDLEKIKYHVLEADRAYLRRIAWKPVKNDENTLDQEIIQTRKEIISALETAVREGLPEAGPRGGAIWPPRYFIRRVAWHVLDHAWEIEDRVMSEL
jgi:hypothetical protein